MKILPRKLERVINMQVEDEENFENDKEEEVVKPLLNIYEEEK